MAQVVQWTIQTNNVRTKRSQMQQLSNELDSLPKQADAATAALEFNDVHGGALLRFVHACNDTHTMLPCQDHKLDLVLVRNVLMNHVAMAQQTNQTRHDGGMLTNRHREG